MTFPLIDGVDSVTLGLENAALVALTEASNAIAAAGTLDAAPPSLLAPAVVSVEAASAAMETALEASDANTANGIEAGGDPAASVTYLNEQISTVTNTSSLLDALAYVDRIAINLALSQD